MSINRNRSKLNKALTRSDYQKIWMNEIYPDYWDEGMNFYPRYRKGFKNSNRQIEMYQVRAYRTWKHTRLHQWKY